MFDQINDLIDFLGTGNTVTIIVFILGIFYAFYLNFKTLYRLVYSTERICKRAEEYIDWSAENNVFQTRILLYNNGRKTITRDEIKKLQFTSSGHIKEIRELNPVKKIHAKLGKNKADVEFDYLDSSDFILLEVTHTGNLAIEGRISESGKIIRTETKTWLIINIVFILMIFGLLFFNIFNLLTPSLESFLTFGLNLLMLIAFPLTIRYLHRLFFIPDSLSATYLGVKDKWNREFNNSF